jgi:outer membrane protein OmpA-like peptidoglycan-associated protein
MLVEAETAYESGNYRKSLALLEEVMKRPDGQLMKTYAGLYSTYYRLGHLDLAEKAFDKLLSISVEKNRILTVKFLFDVNSLEFWRDPNLKAQYGMWLRRIGKYFYNSLYCLKITGHCSRSGGEQHNNRLSLERAYRIQQLLQAEFPDVLNRSEAVGRGFKDNIVGTGTDDERDAIDRRVEFFVVDCE